MTVKVIIVVTSHSALGNTGNKTGWYLPEVAHPYHVFKNAGIDVTFVSPKGGIAPMDPGSGVIFNEDKICNEFRASAIEQLKHTKSPNEIDIRSGYKAILYAGGHGPMWDVATDVQLAKLCAHVYENGGVVGAVCHGTAGLLPVKLSNGEYLLKGKTVTSFTNGEEAAVALTDVMPFLLETRLKELGAKFVAKDNFQENVQVDDRLVTGQNPASSTKTAKEILRCLCL